MLFLISCSEKEVVQKSLTERNGKVYEVNQEKPFTGLSFTKYSNEQFKEKGRYKKGLQSGLWEYFTKQGQLTKSIEYKNGKRNGESKEYTNKGAIRTEANYKKDNLHGKMITYYSNGQVKRKENYTKNTLNGLYETFSKNGNSLIKIEYLNGEYNGNYKEYNNKNILVRDINYKKGKYDGIYAEYYENGNIFKKTTYKDGLIDGKYIDYYKGGNINKSYNYSAKNEIYDGDFFKYNVDKSVNKHIYYKNGKGVNKGTWKRYWNKNNQISSVPAFSYSTISFDGNGKPSTTVKFFYQKNGKIKDEISYKSLEPDIREGEVKHYAENGSLIMKGNYKNNVRDGLWETYYDKKNIVETYVKESVNYKNGVLEGKYTYFYNSNYGQAKYTNPKFINHKPQTDDGYWKLEGYLSNGKLNKTWKLWLMYRKYNRSNSCWHKMNVYSTSKWNRGNEIENSYLSLQSNLVYDKNNRRLKEHWRNLAKEVIKTTKPLFCR